VFTLTGTEIPDQMFIQIMTINGKVVKEITQDELGPINIGRNITEYAWDGTDNYGDKLANGVYLYKVQTQIDGVEIKRREEEVSSAQDGTTLSSKYFKNGIGKLYILR
jgi:flagellar hook assembly protein FlgD